MTVQTLTRIVAAAVAVPLITYAQQPDFPPLDVAITGSMTPAQLTAVLDPYLTGLDRDQFSGVVLIARDGKPVFEKAYGLAVRERSLENTPATRFNIGSINKPFTRVAIAQLMAQGKLALSDTIGKILPDHPNPKAHAATVDQLQDHRGGIANIFGPAFDRMPKTDLQSNADYYRLVASQPLTFAPGTGQQYCNGCYVVLGAMIERISGMRFEDYMIRHVFQPAGMSRAGFLSANDAEVAVGYTRRGSRPGGGVGHNRELHGERGSAAGGAYATAADLLAFDNGLREGRLLDRRMSAWFFDADSLPAEGRIGASFGTAGGAPGTNALLETDGPWTVVVLTNLDPPSAERLGIGLMQKLRKM